MRKGPCIVLWGWYNHRKKKRFLPVPQALKIRITWRRGLHLNRYQETWSHCWDIRRRRRWRCRMALTHPNCVIWYVFFHSLICFELIFFNSYDVNNFITTIYVFKQMIPSKESNVPLLCKNLACDARSFSKLTLVVGADFMLSHGLYFSAGFETFDLQAYLSLPSSNI